MMASTTDPYAAAHMEPKGSGDARPTALKIVQDEGLINAMADKVMLVTGASSGIGVETVRALHATGAKIFMQVRDVQKGEAVKKEILASSGSAGDIEIVKMDLNSFSSIREGVTDMLRRTDRLNVLVNNAGVRNTPEGTTEDRIETQFAVNHLSHFLLFQSLLPTLLSSATPAFASRVVNLTSGGHRGSPMHLDNPNLTGIYTPRLGYAQSKTANILMANHIETLYGHRDVHGLSVHPGAIWTGLQKHDAQPTPEVAKVLAKIEKNKEQGAATTVWACIGKLWEGKGRVYLEDCRQGHEVEEVTVMDGGYKKFAFDEEAEEKLWALSCKMVGNKGTI